MRTRTTCPTAQDTKDLAARVAQILQPGDVVLLEGELGAGKTTWTQGMAASLGADGPVTSPTFTLMNVYPTPASAPLVHVDVYRLELLSEVVDLGLGEMLDDGAIAVVEWGDRAEAALPGDRLWVSIEAGEDGCRHVELAGQGRSWEQRWPQVESAVR